MIQTIAINIVYVCAGGMRINEIKTIRSLLRQQWNAISFDTRTRKAANVANEKNKENKFIYMFNIRFCIFVPPLSP